MNLALLCAVTVKVSQWIEEKLTMMMMIGIYCLRDEVCVEMIRDKKYDINGNMLKIVAINKPIQTRIDNVNVFFRSMMMKMR
jgi:hypothetical protein